MKIRESLGSALAQELLADLASGLAGSPLVEIYTGEPPASMGVSITDTLLATFTLSETVGTETGGVVTLSGWTDEASAPAGGHAGWARFLNRDGDEIIYVSAGGPGSGSAVVVNPEEIVEGDPVNLTSAVIRMPV